MTNHEMNAEPGRDEVQGTPLGMSNLVAAWMRLHAQLHAAVKAALAGPGDAVAAMLRREEELQAAVKAALAGPGAAATAMLRRQAELQAAMKAASAGPGAALAAMVRRDEELQAAMRTAWAGWLDPRDTAQQQDQAPKVEKTHAELPELLVPAGIVAIGDSVPEGQLIEAVMLPWFDIINALERDPSYLHQLDWRRVEELIAGAYTRDGWPEVILTPRSGDGGRDIIASKPGFGAIRFYDQVKAYGPGQRISANDVRAIFGVVHLHQNVSKAVITTTTLFAPGVREEFKAVMPNRLELRDGRALRKWLLGFLPERQGS